jgi:hypothetical protein
MSWLDWRTERDIFRDGLRQHGLRKSLGTGPWE